MIDSIIQWLISISWWSSIGVVAIDSFITNEYNHKNAKCADAKTAIPKYNDCSQCDRNIRRSGRYCDQSNGQQADWRISFKLSDKKLSTLKCRSHGHDSPLSKVYFAKPIFIVNFWCVWRLSIHLGCKRWNEMQWCNSSSFYRWSKYVERVERWPIICN